jgi:hypothetical protein
MENSRISQWRQGSVLDTQAGREFLSSVVENSEDMVVIVASHDCDIASSPGREPFVEVVVGTPIPALGADTHAKTARRLHVSFQTAEGQTPVEFVATSKFSIPKEDLLKATPRAGWNLQAEDLITFQKWLAARYRRAAFADEFETRLKAKPARIDKKIAKILEVPSEHILSVLFEVDGGQELSRIGPDDIYELGITLLYDSTKDEPLAFEAAQKSAEAIELAFEKAYSRNGNWQNIKLLYCTPVSDNAMTIAQGRFLKQWRLDYMSLEEVPHEPILELE